MIYAVITVLAGGCLLNFALILRIARQLRHVNERLEAGPTVPGMRRLPVGGKVRDFTATTVTGELVARQQLTGGQSLIAFFSVGCPACRIQLPQFIDYAESFPGGAARVLAVVGGPPGEGGDLVGELAGHASVVVERRGGTLAAALSVSGYPTFYVVDEEGRVTASGPQVVDLPSPAVTR